MQILTVEEAYEKVVRQPTANRWFARADVVAWPRRAWTESTKAGGWSVVTDENGTVWFAARTVDAYRRAVEVSLIEPSLRCHDAASQYAVDYLNAAAIVCWLPDDGVHDDLRGLAEECLLVPGHYDTGSGPVDAVILETERKDDHAYLSIP